MNNLNIFNKLREFISQEILEGHDVGLDENTPLLDLGILNSMELIRLVAFIEKQFSIVVPGEKIVHDHFRDLGSISRLVAQPSEIRV